MTQGAQSPEPTVSDIWQAVVALRYGQVVAVATDTVFGLVALMDCEPAIRRIYDLKRRPHDNPLPILMSTAADLPLVAKNVPDIAWPCISAFWPGTLTIILESTDAVSPVITAETGRVGVRVPARSPVLELLEALEFPVASTSANLTGQPPITDEADLRHHFGDEVHVLTSDPPLSASGQPSTVVDLTSHPIVIRRKGEISPDQLRKALSMRVEIARDA